MTNEDKAVLLNEEKGRQEFNDLCRRKDVNWCRINKFSKKRHDHWDLSLYSDNQPIIADIKKRRYTHDVFLNEWYLEKDKADELIKIAIACQPKQEKEIKIGYIHLFADNLMAMWEFTVNQLKEMTTVKRLVQKNDWSDEKVWKDVYLLPYGQAQRKEEIDLTKSIFNK